jgi:hypothetical protein
MMVIRRQTAISWNTQDLPISAFSKGVTLSSSCKARLGIVLLGTVCLLGTTGVVASAQAAPPAHTAPAVSPLNLDGTWSCGFPPAGYTYDAIQQVLNACGTGMSIRYHLRLPVDGLNACAIPPGWAVTSVHVSHNVCSLSGTAFQYRLATPTTGLWSCNVPAGWFIRHQMMVYNICGSGQAPRYQLTR